jgi:hypothetical protein
MLPSFHPSSASFGLVEILTASTLAARWGKSERTLQRMRAAGKSPPHFRIGKTIFYRLEDVLAFEVAALVGEIS